MHSEPPVSFGLALTRHTCNTVHTYIAWSFAQEERAGLQTRSMGAHD